MVIAKRGSLPTTPHTEFYFIPGVLALEEIHGSYGFGGPWARKMHVRKYPTEVKNEPKIAEFNFIPKEREEKSLQPYLIHSADIPYEGDALISRKCLLWGTNTKISMLKTEKSFPKDKYFRNGDGHEIFFVQDGEALVSTEYGELHVRKNHYVVIPKGTTYRIDLKSEKLWLLVVESKFLIEWPPHYMNHSGQAHMMAPIVETEINLPELGAPKDEQGEFTVYVQHGGGQVTELAMSHHPFDVCGWEGALYPYSFDIANHHGIARAIHSAPPQHQTFQSGQAPYFGFAICSFVAQPEGWHPRDVAAPYAHFNVDSDEMMFFSNVNYGARKSVLKEGTMTFHPGACPHSPHGNAAEKSLDEKGKMSSRLAVMLDTFFEPLNVSQYAVQYSDKEYSTSWYKAREAKTLSA
ncbi:MAG: homogentisate 1,2-dioxygenase [Bdellovibrionota bacterium]